MAYGSVAETGAKPGDKVKCVRDRDNHPRFRVGETYTVVDFCGTPCVHGHIPTKDGEKPSRFGMRGFGYDWELVE